MADRSKKYDSRSILLTKNILASFFVKGWSAIVVLLMVPLTLKCLGSYQNGVWLTISSMLVWIDQMDIGLGNGLRNSLATHLAHGEKFEARKVVSSTVAMLSCITIPLAIILSLLIWTTDVYSFFNVDSDAIPELRVALCSAVILVCLTFVLKFINNVYTGLQLPAVSNLIMAICQTVSLIFTALIYFSGKASFLDIVIINTAAPLIVYTFSYTFTFYRKYVWLKPSIKAVDLTYSLNLGKIGIKFFWIQIASVLQFMTANILISKFFTPEMVTPYQIAYKYMSLVIVAFTVICSPFWSATTDAFEKSDIQWIRNASNRLDRLMGILTLLLVLMTAASPIIYRLWIGESCSVPFGMTVMMAIYVFLLIVSMRYSFFLNGIGALKLQLYTSVSAVVFIPLAWIVSTTTHDIIWFMSTMCICLIPGLVVNIIQFNKIINGTAKGIWGTS